MAPPSGLGASRQRRAALVTTAGRSLGGHARATAALVLIAAASARGELADQCSSGSPPDAGLTSLLQVRATKPVLQGDLRRHWVDVVRTVQADCGLKALDIDINKGGGFASKFQLASSTAMKFMRRGNAVRLVGHFGGYSKIDHCKEALGPVFDESSFTCFFQPARTCKEQTPGGPSAETRRAIEQLQSVKRGSEDETLLFQAIEAHFFRLNDATLAEMTKRLEAAGVPPAALEGAGGAAPLLFAAHVRRGDKVIDPYNRYYTSGEYAAALVAGAEAFTGEQRDCIVYVASDSAPALGEMQRLLEGKSSGSCRFRVVGQGQTVTQAASTVTAQNSRDPSMNGMVQTMTSSDALQATYEILLDIFALSHSSLMVGMLTSQIGRLAAGLRLDMGKGEVPAIGMDFERAGKEAKLAAKYGIPDPKGEEWRAVPDETAAEGEILGVENEWVAAIRAVQGDCSLPAQQVEIPHDSHDPTQDFAGELLGLVDAAAAVLRKGQPFSVSGHFAGHSDRKFCRAALGAEIYDGVGSFTCFFTQERRCSAGKQVGAVLMDTALDSAEAIKRLKSLRPEDEAAFHRAVEAFVFRFNAATMASVLKRKYFLGVDTAGGGEYGRIVGVDASRLVLGVDASWTQETMDTLDEIVGRVSAWASTKHKGEASPTVEAKDCLVYVAGSLEVQQALAKKLDENAAGGCKLGVKSMQMLWGEKGARKAFKAEAKNRDAIDALSDILFLSRADSLLHDAGSSEPHGPLSRLALGLRPHGHGDGTTAA